MPYFHEMSQITVPSSVNLPRARRASVSHDAETAKAEREHRAAKEAQAETAREFARKARGPVTVAALETTTHTRDIVGAGPLEIVDRNGVRPIYTSHSTRVDNANLIRPSLFVRVGRKTRQAKAAKEQATAKAEIGRDTPCLRCKKYGGACKAAWNISSVKNALLKVESTDWCPHIVFTLGAAVCTLDETLKEQGKMPLPKRTMEIAVQMKRNYPVVARSSRSATGFLPCSENYERNSATLASIRAAIDDARCSSTQKEDSMREAHQAKAAEAVVRHENDKAKRAQRATLEEQAEFERASRNEPHNLLLVWSAWNAMRRKHVFFRRLAEDDICPRILQKHWALGQAWHARQAQQLAELVYVGCLFVVATWRQLRRDKRIA